MTTLRNSDGKVYHRSDCLQGSNVHENEEVDCNKGRLQLNRLTTSPKKRGGDSSPIKRAQSVCVKSTIDIPYNQQRHLSAMQSTQSCSGWEAEDELSKQKKERSTILTVTTQLPNAVLQKEERIVGKTWPGHGTFESEMELKIVEPQNPPVRQWVIGPCLQSIKSKVSSFTEIVGSPVQTLKSHDDVSPSHVNLAFQNTNVFNLHQHHVIDTTHKRRSSEGKTRDSPLLQSNGLETHKRTDSENGGKQVLFLGEEQEIELAVRRLHNCPVNAELQLDSDSQANDSPLDSTRSRLGSSLCSSVGCPDLHYEVLPSSNSKCTRLLSAEALQFCNLKEENAGLTVSSLPHDMEEDLGQVRNLEGVKDPLLLLCPHQTNVEEEEIILEDCAIAAPLPGLSSVTPTDSTCNISSLVPEEGVETSKVREDEKAGLFVASVKPEDALQAKHQALHSLGSRPTEKGPHTGKIEEVGEDGSVHRAQTEMICQETRVKFRKGGKQKKELEKIGEESVRDLLAATTPETKGRKRTANPKLPDKNPHLCLDSRGKVNRTSLNKVTQMSHGLGFGSETESGRERCGKLRRKAMKSPKQFITEAPPTMGEAITESDINRSAMDLTNSSFYSCIKRISNKSKSTINTCVNSTRNSKNRTVDIASHGLSRIVCVSLSRMGKTSSEAEIESSSPVLEGSVWASTHSVTNSAVVKGSIQRKEKEGEVNALMGGPKPKLGDNRGVQSRGQQNSRSRKKRMDIQSVGNPRSTAVQESIGQIRQSEMAEESQGNETSGQGSRLQMGRSQQRMKYSNVKEAKDTNRYQDSERFHKVEKGDKEGTLCYRELQREWLPEQESANDIKLYPKQACKIRTVSVQGKDEYETMAHLTDGSSKTILSSLGSQEQLQMTVNEPSDFLSRSSDVGCNIQSNIHLLNVKETTTQEFTQISSNFFKTERVKKDIKESGCDSNPSSSSGNFGKLEMTNTEDTSTLFGEHCGNTLENAFVEEGEVMTCYLPVHAEMKPLIPDHQNRKLILKQSKTEDNGEGALILSSTAVRPELCEIKVERESGGVLLEPGKLYRSTEKGLRDEKESKLKQRKTSRKFGTYKRKERRGGLGKDTPTDMKELWKKDHFQKILGSTPLPPPLKRRHSCPEIPPTPVDGPWTAPALPSPLGRLPCSPVYSLPRSLQRSASVKRARRHTVCSLEVEREIAPLCLRKEVYPIGQGGLYGSPSRIYPNFPSCNSFAALSSCFLSSPLAFLSRNLKEGSGNSGSNSQNIASSSACSAAIPSPSSLATKLVPSLRDDGRKLKQEDAEENGRFSVQLDAQEKHEEKSLSDSEIKVVSVKQGERGKVSRIKIRKTLPKTPTNLTPMGLPKPVRLKKKDFSLEEIYTNKNFRQPSEGRLETIFEMPISCPDGSVSVTGQRRVKRLVDFPEVGMPRKPRKPLIGTRSGVPRKACESSNFTRTRRGGSDKAKEGYTLTLQEIESILCSKLDQLDTWIALDEEDLSV